MYQTKGTNSEAESHWMLSMTTSLWQVLRRPNPSLPSVGKWGQAWKLPQLSPLISKIEYPWEKMTVISTELSMSCVSLKRVIHPWESSVSSSSSPTKTITTSHSVSPLSARSYERIGLSPLMLSTSTWARLGEKNSFGGAILYFFTRSVY